MIDILILQVNNQFLTTHLNCIMDTYSSVAAAIMDTLPAAMMPTITLKLIITYFIKNKELKSLLYFQNTYIPFKHTFNKIFMNKLSNLAQNITNYMEHTS